MNVATYAAFKDELEKLGWHAGAEIAGLGLLAAPTAAKHFGGKEWSEKNKRRAELGGLGILAAPAAHSMYKAVKKGGMTALKHASVDASLAGGALSLFKTADLDAWNPHTGEVIGGSVGSAAANRGMSAAKHVPAKKPTFSLEHLRSAYQKSGIKPGLASAARQVAKHASIDKEAFLGKLLGKATPVAKQVFKPSFAGHAKALGVGTDVAKSGVETVKSFNPLTQTMSRSKSISIPGLR